MSVLFARRRDPQPASQGWEVAAAAVGAALTGLALAALTGLGAASALFGGGWVWPHGSDTIGAVLGGLITGHPGQGLPPSQVRLIAGPVPVYACIAVAEAALAALARAAGMAVTGYRLPGDARSGMATRREAEQVLGLSRLRVVKAIIRPDLYGSDQGPGQ